MSKHLAAFQQKFTNVLPMSYYGSGDFINFYDTRTNAVWEQFVKDQKTIDDQAQTIQEVKGCMETRLEGIECLQRNSNTKEERNRHTYAAKTLRSLLDVFPKEGEDSTQSIAQSIV